MELKKIMMCVLLVNMLNASPTYAEEETDAETQELLKQYEENLQEIARLNEKNADSKEEEKAKETSEEVFDPIEAEYLEQEKNKPEVIEKKVVEEVPEIKFSFDWRGTSLAQSIYGIAKVAGMGVVVNTEVKGTVYTSLKVKDGMKLF